MFKSHNVWSAKRLTLTEASYLVALRRPIAKAGKPHSIGETGSAREGLAGASAPPRKTKAPR